MAGIGFELRRILAKDTYTSMVKGYFYATVISSGPWLMSVISLAFLAIYTIAFLGFEQRQLFASTIVYIYAGSLVGTGLTQMLVTRYLADALYQGSRRALSETFVPVILLTLATQLPMAIGVLHGTPLSPAYRFAATMTFLLVSLIWQAMIFLSASRDYKTIVLAFALSALISVGAGLLWGQRFGVVGYMFGFGVGQAVAFAILTIKVFVEYGIPRRWDWSFISYIKQYPSLIGIGFFYNLAIWIDKFIFGLSERGLITAGRFPTYNHYDSSMFLAFAATIPSMAIFLARTETDFADTYKRYYDDIFFRRPYARILQSKQTMIDALKRSFTDLLKIQGLITALLVFFGDDILMAVGLPYSQTATFRYALIGAFQQVLMLFIFIVLLYFDLRGTVLFLAGLFLALISGFTLLSIQLGFPFYGLGFAVACFIALLTSSVTLYWRIHNLEYITFARRKIVGQRWATGIDRSQPTGMYGRYHPCPGGHGSLKLKSNEP
jgi:polysaccharide biosynthesis protein PelG